MEKRIALRQKKLAFVTAQAVDQIKAEVDAEVKREMLTKNQEVEHDSDIEYSSATRQCSHFLFSSMKCSRRFQRSLRLPMRTFGCVSDCSRAQQTVAVRQLLQQVPHLW